MQLLRELSDYLGYDLDTTKVLMSRACNSYRRYFKKKKDGGERAILHPSAVTKSLQYGLIEILLRPTFKPHESAMAYIEKKSRPLIENANAHRRLQYSIRVDFKEFFPSVQPEDLLLRMSRKGVLLSTEESTLLRTTLFVPKYMAVRSFSDETQRIKKMYWNGTFGLAIGAPASPMISNIVMYELDIECTEYARSRKGVYTRYADDIIFSCNKRGGCNEFLEHLRSLIEKNSSPKLTINEEKTLFMSRGTRRIVTGIRIKPDGGLSLGRDKKRQVRAMLHWLKHDKLDDKKLAYLRGYLSFVIGTEPDFYNRMVIKYGGALIKKAQQA